MRLCATLILICSLPVLAQDDLPLAEAHRLLDSGDIQGAEQSVQTYLTSHKDSGAAHFLMGYILFKKLNAKASLAQYTEGARYQKPSSYDLEVVGCDYVLLKDYTDADKWLSRAVEWNAANISALYYLGRTKYNENRFDEAVEIFQRCLKADPKSVKYNDNLGLSLQGLGKNDEAAAAFRAALDLDKSSATHDSGPYLDLGSLLLDEQHAAEAIPLLEQATEIAPRDLRARTQLGKAYLHSDQLTKAKTQLEAAVAIDPRSAPTRFMLAQVYRKLGLLEKARQESEAYTALNAEHAAETTR